MGVKRPRSGHKKAIEDVWRREVGLLSSRNFANRLAASEDLVLKLDILRKLEKHRGCVNTVSFNASGEILVSGSDDRKVVLWDWEIGHAKLSFHSGHGNNIFQAKFMPYSDDSIIVTCAADGQVRHARILEGGRVETSLLGRHQGRAHKLAIEPGSPHIFYTCGEDGLVQHFDLRAKTSTKLFTCHATIDGRSISPIVNLNTIAIDPRIPNLFAVGGTDEYTRVYDIRRYKQDGSNDFDKPINFFCPEHLVGNEQVGITGLAFSEQSELLVSYNYENIYLFTKDMGWGPNPAPSSPESICSDTDEPEHDESSEAATSVMDTEKKPDPQLFKGHLNRETVKGVGFFGPKSEYVVSGSDCGRIFIWRKKDGELIRVMEADKHVVNCIEAHPHNSVLASSGIDNDIKIWTPKAEERATLPANIDEVLISDRSFMFESDDSDDDNSSTDDDDDDDSENDEMYDLEGNLYGYYSDDDDEDDDDDDEDDGGSGDDSVGDINVDDHRKTDNDDSDGDINVDDHRKIDNDDSFNVGDDDTNDDNF